MEIQIRLHHVWALSMRVAPAFFGQQDGLRQVNNRNSDLAEKVIRLNK